MRKLLLIWFLCWLTLVDAVAATLGAGHWEELLVGLTAEQQANAIPVMALVLFDGGRVVHRLMHTLPGAEPLEDTTPLRWGSITKTVTALALLQATRAHDVDPDTPVTLWLPTPPYHNPWADQQPMRLVHLLELTAGLPDLTRAEFDDNVPRPLAEALRRAAAERIERWPPGLQTGYSNAPPGLAAALLEQITGESFEEAVARWVFRPVGMTGASFRPDAQLPGGFRADAVTPIPYWHVTFTAFGGLNASPLAMSRLLEALLNRGRVEGREVIPEVVVDRVYRSETSLGARAGLEIGYGAGMYAWVRNGQVFYGHGGDADGYLSRFGLLPGAGRGYLLGINTDNAAAFNRLRRLLERSLTADLARPVAPARALVPPDELARLAGRYYPATTRFDVDRWERGALPVAEVVVRDGELEFRHGGRETGLVPVTSTQFRRHGDPAVSVVLAEYCGRLLLQGVLGAFVHLAGQVRFDPAMLSPCDSGVAE
ncbi:MAG: serine hydrolase domain-containing protein [Pseudomonadales bacterium]